MSFKDSRESRVILMINPDLQVKIIAFMLAISWAVIGVVYATNAYVFSNLKRAATQTGIDPVYAQLFSEQQSMMNVVFLVVGIAVSALVVSCGLVLSHRIAGPIYKLCSHFKNIAQGGPIQNLQFRENDFFQEIPDFFDGVVERWKGELEAAKKPAASSEDADSNVKSIKKKAA